MSRHQRITGLIEFGAGSTPVADIGAVERSNGASFYRDNATFNPVVAGAVQLL